MSERARLLEEGRRLASWREDLIAAGAAPGDLEIPLAPGEWLPRCPGCLPPDVRPHACTRWADPDPCRCRECR